MRRNAKVTLRIGLALIVWAALAVHASEPIEPLESIPQPLPEGTMLKSVDGLVVPADGNDLWLFEVGEDVNDTTPQIRRGTRLALLPSATLEKLVSDANDRQSPRYRLSAHVTQYCGANYLWPSYYVPLSRLKDANEPTPMAAPVPTIDANAVVVDPTDSTEMTIPDEIVERLRTRRTPRVPQRAVSDTAPTGPVVRKPATRVLVDAVGFVQRGRGAPVFVPDALGWNVAAVQYELLPCRVLEQIEQQVAAWPEPVRLKIAGIVTEYRGRQYMLLQRVMRVHNYGNFGG